MTIKRRFWETERMFRRRQEIEDAKETLAPRRLWRIDAIEMKGGRPVWTMGSHDHFTIEAVSKEAAVGAFKCGDHMNWFVVGVCEEKVFNG